MEPRVGIEQESARAIAADRWLVSWSVRNLGNSPLTILSARLPHGKFRSEEKSFAPAIDIAAGGRGTIEMDARAGEAPGSIVENAFLLLRVDSGGAPWLVLARLTVRARPDGTPDAATESITAQPVGFSRFGMMGW